MIDRRRASFQSFQEQLQGELDPEEWKRLDHRSFSPDDYELQHASAEDVPTETLLRDQLEFAGHVAFVDGQNVLATLQKELKEKGVLFGNLAEILNEEPKLIQDHFMTKGVQETQDRYAAWHGAFWTGGTVLYVPRNVELEQPLHSLIALAQAGAADFSHTLVILEEGASATLLEETISTTSDSPGLHMGAVELLLSPNARLCYVQLQNWNQQTTHFAHQCGRVDQNASLQWTVGGLGAKFAHIHQDVMLDGQGAYGEVNGVTFANNRQRISYYTQQHHRALQTKSDLLYKEVLRDHSRVVWRGMIKVDEIAQLTDGYQRSDALMLSKDARADAIPGLEIEADDVRCTHGATVGQVDEEQLFYCMSRGLSQYEAMHLVVEGFFQQVYDRIPVEAVRETLSQTVERKLGIGD